MVLWVLVKIKVMLMDKCMANVDLVWPARPNFSLTLIKFKVGLVGLGCFGRNISLPLYIGYWQTLVYSVPGGCCLVATTCILYNTLPLCICECWHHNCFACYQVTHLIHIIKGTMTTMSRIAINRNEAIIAITGTSHTES